MYDTVSFRIRDGVNSDYMPLELELLLEERRGRRQGKEPQKKEEKEGKEIEIFVWDQEAIKKYAEITAEMQNEEGRKQGDGNCKREMEKNQKNCT